MHNYLIRARIRQLIRFATHSRDTRQWRQLAEYRRCIRQLWSLRNSPTSYAVAVLQRAA